MKLSDREVLERAAQGAYTQLERDRRRADGDLGVFLDHLRDHLFDPGLDIGTALRACGLRDKAVYGRFRVTFGVTPRLYVESLRLATARRLFRGDPLALATVARLVGYSRASVLSDAFARRYGLRPAAYRLQAPGRPREGADGPSGDGEDQATGSSTVNRAPPSPSFCALTVPP